MQAHDVQPDCNKLYLRLSVGLFWCQLLFVHRLKTPEENQAQLWAGVVSGGTL